MSRFSLFLYGQLKSPYHGWLNMAGLVASVWWLYFSLVEKAFVSRFMAGDLMLLDLLVGLPLVLALAPVVYALVYWSGKWVIILLRPDLVIPPPDGSSQDD